MVGSALDTCVEVRANKAVVKIEGAMDTLGSKVVEGKASLASSTFIYSQVMVFD